MMVQLGNYVDATRGYVWLIISARCRIRGPVVYKHTVTRDHSMHHEAAHVCNRRAVHWDQIEEQPTQAAQKQDQAPGFGHTSKGTSRLEKHATTVRFWTETLIPVRPKLSSLVVLALMLLRLSGLRENIWRRMISTYSQAAMLLCKSLHCEPTCKSRQTKCALRL